MTQDRSCDRASASIETRKKKQFPFWELSAQMRNIFSKVLIHRMPAVLAKGGLRKINLTIFLAMTILLSNERREN
jgi:hypothetical protein